MKYDEFLYQGELINLSDALNKTNDDLSSKYDRSALFCPQCGIAQLRFVRGTYNRGPFLSTRPSSFHHINEHASDCEYSYKRASKKEVVRYYKGLNDGQIKDKLSAAIALYQRQRTDNTSSPSPQSPVDNPNLISTNITGKRVYKRLPKRSIYSIYDVPDEQLNVPIMLYGKVKLKAEIKQSPYDKNQSYYKLLVLSLKNNLIRFFNLPKLPIPVDENKVYYFVIIAFLTKNSEGTLLSKVYKSYLPSVSYIPV